MANNSIQQTVETASLIKEMCDLFAHESPLRSLKDCAAAFKEVPTAFEALRKAINSANAVMKDYFSVYDRFSATWGNALGLGVTARLQAVALCAKDLEDDNTFLAALAKIGEEKDVRIKMKSCITMNDTLTTIINGWNSKLVKLIERRSLAGSTEAEIAITERKEFAIKEVIENLRRRGDAVSQIYYACKRELESFISASDRAFKPMFANESPGKNHDESGSEQGGEVK